jgi:hypothetical protein
VVPRAAPQSLAILLTVAAPVAVCIGCYSAMGDGPAIYAHLSGRGAALYPALVSGCLTVLFLMYLLDAPYWSSRGLRAARRLLLAGVGAAALAAALLAAGDLPALPLSVLLLLGVLFVLGARHTVLSSMDDAVWGKALGRTLWLAAVVVAVWWALWVSGCVLTSAVSVAIY